MAINDRAFAILGDALALLGLEGGRYLLTRKRGSGTQDQTQEVNPQGKKGDIFEAALLLNENVREDRLKWIHEQNPMTIARMEREHETSVLADILKQELTLREQFLRPTLLTNLTKIGEHLEEQFSTLDDKAKLRLQRYGDWADEKHALRKKLREGKTTRIFVALGVWVVMSALLLGVVLEQLGLALAVAFIVTICAWIGYGINKKGRGSDEPTE